MHWETLAEVELHGRPHHMMRADLDFYPPCHTPEIGYVALRESGLTMDAAALELRSIERVEGQSGARRQGRIGIVAGAPRARTGQRSRSATTARRSPTATATAVRRSKAHQRLRRADPWFAGWCGVMVNVSDVAAMGGRPLAVVDASGPTAKRRRRPFSTAWRRGRRLWRADRRRPHQSAHRETQLAVAVLGRAGTRLLTSFDAKPGDALDHGRRQARRLPRAVRQFSGGARRAARASARRSRAAAGACRERTLRAPPRTSARAAFPARR